MKKLLIILLLVPSLSWGDSQKKVLKKFCEDYYELILKQDLEIVNKGLEALEDENTQWVEDNYSKFESAQKHIFDQGYKWSIICSSR